MTSLTETARTTCQPASFRKKFPKGVMYGNECCAAKLPDQSCSKISPMAFGKDTRSCPFIPLSPLSPREWSSAAALPSRLPAAAGYCTSSGRRSAARCPAPTSRMASPRFPPATSCAEAAESPSVAIVSAYNDMLSAHQPFERFPPLIKRCGARRRRRGAVRRRRAGHVRRRDARPARHGTVAVFARHHRHGDRHRAVAQHVRRRACTSASATRSCRAC